MASLRALECLVAIADTGSITQAARLLHSSQPAVSHQLATLEREARTTLVRRERRGVTLTPAGRAAVADARRAVTAAADAVRSARAAGEAAGGTLRLACAQSLCVPLVAPVIRGWHRSHPEVMVTLRESAKMAELAGWLDSGEVDLVLVPAPVPDWLASAVVTVAEEEVVLTAPTGHHLADQPTVRIADLDGAPLVHFAPDNGLSAWLDRSLAEAGVHPEPVMRTSVTTAAPQLAAAGLGVAVSPVSAVSPGFPGVVRSFSPRWVRRLVALRPTTSDPLTDRFVEDVRARGVGVPEDVRAQLTGNSEPSK